MITTRMARLPASPYRHAEMPEMEGCPPVATRDGVATEFRMPLAIKE